MSEYLREDGYSVFESENGESALEVLETNHIDLLITDVMMPKMDGFILSKKLRISGYELPILMITAKNTTGDKRTGFSAGADDYMVKPIDMDEMIIRVSALLRRAKSESDKKIIIGSTTLNYNDFSGTINGKNIELPKKEFQIAFMMLSQPNRIFTRMQIMDKIWGYETESSTRTVDVHIRNLRKKFEGNTDFEIATVKGLGYKAVKL
jgi:DNA-binding response OmpR family regulator